MAVLNRDDKIKSCVVGMATEDASFMEHTTMSVNDSGHPDLPALLVCIHYLIQAEVKKLVHRTFFFCILYL